MSLNSHTGATNTGSQTKGIHQIAVSADSSDIECRLKSLELSVDKQYNAFTQRLDQVLSALPNNRPPQQRPYYPTPNYQDRGRGSLNGCLFTALIDSGSMVTTISENGLKSLSEKPQIIPLDTLGLKLSTADGSLLKYCGYVEGTICVPSMSNIAFDVPILVIKDNSFNRNCPVSVGTNVIRLVRDIIVSHDSSEVIPEEWNIAIASLNVISFAAKLSTL
ncbi:hypothetical protein DPMN_048571 [Dreissena polymorpha]|uniref:Uncharacterized protein n=1 Tax=Dreissena polymorpha TaxID=45954 RepID=A0A9D4DAX8_DREPO|nr:hypothetical protein DPMN_048571 [Dreissena polymorpha]